MMSFEVGLARSALRLLALLQKGHADLVAIEPNKLTTHDGCS
jgi:hypothetical protein